MIDRLPLSPTDLRGLARLATAATVGAIDLAEQVHDGLSNPLRTRAGRRPVAGQGLKGAVYGWIRGVAGAVGRGLDAALSPLECLDAVADGSREREAWLAALNGMLGDHLAATGNPLALPMTLRHQGADLEREPSRLMAAVPEPSPHLLVLVHGLCRSDRHWSREGHDHGEALARDLGCTPLYLRYNSGRHVSDNGRDLAELLEDLVSRWPVPVQRISILAHSLGGLVARSACCQGAAAGHTWPAALRDLVFLGTPHHGSPLERGGHLLNRLVEASPFAGPLARIGKLRSAGITDLRHGNLLEADWKGRSRFARGGDRRIPVPLPAAVRCFALAASAGPALGTVGSRWLGDGLVPVDSALGRHRDPARELAFPANRVWIGDGLGHMDLLSRPEAYARIRSWLAGK